ncbi:MAG: 23S rRNA (pseudouridine(1915)-N(3))-methyltransferase RlmH, partial [Deltaproteobacteria bacterium]|nr:23S rRNA (pseudouridine(1915)-N(3))-methyltransferase RlmH [Deltaproteobacteria bacterium]
MKFVFLFLGKTRERYLDQGIQDYAGRLRRFVQAEIVVLKERHNR